MSYDLADIRAVQDYFGFLRPEPIEKDWHVVRALAAIAALETAPFRLIFAGGTCLARAHRLVRRMSEDVDLKIVPAESDAISRSQLRKRLSELRANVTNALLTAGFNFDPADKIQVWSRDENRYTVHHLPYAAGDNDGRGLRPTIQIEMTYTELLRLAPVTLPVSSFVAEAFGRAPELPAIDCVSVTETAAEKLVGLTRRIAMELAGVSRAPDPTLVRHIYDLHIIRNAINGDIVARLARQIAITDAAEFKNQYPAYEADISGETRKALAVIENEPVYRDRYGSFVQAMVYGEKPDFDQALKTLKELAARFCDEDSALTLQSGIL